MKQFIEAGEFVTTHGVMGELKLYPWCDGPEFVAALPRLFFTPEGGRETKVEGRKRSYVLTPTGREALEAEARRLRQLTADYERLMESEGGAP